MTPYNDCFERITLLPRVRRKRRQNHDPPVSTSTASVPWFREVSRFHRALTGNNKVSTPLLLVLLLLSARTFDYAPSSSSSSIFARAAHSRRRFVPRKSPPFTTFSDGENRYDRSITTFSDDGRLLQVEYGMIASNRGLTVASFDFDFGKGENGENRAVCVVVLTTEDTVETEEEEAEEEAQDSRDVTSEGGTKEESPRKKKPIVTIQGQWEVTKVHRIDSHALLITTGLSGDGWILASSVRIACQRLRLSNGETPTLSEIAEVVSNMQHELTRTGGARPFGCTATLVGVDPLPDEDDVDDDDDDDDEPMDETKGRVHDDEEKTVVDDLQLAQETKNGKADTVLLDRTIDQNNIGNDTKLTKTSTTARTSNVESFSLPKQGEQSSSSSSSSSSSLPPPQSILGVPKLYQSEPGGTVEQYDVCAAGRDRDVVMKSLLELRRGLLSKHSSWTNEKKTPLSSQSSENEESNFDITSQRTSRPGVLGEVVQGVAKIVLCGGGGDVDAKSYSSKKATKHKMMKHGRRVDVYVIQSDVQQRGGIRIRCAKNVGLDGLDTLMELFS